MIQPSSISPIVAAFFLGLSVASFFWWLKFRGLRKSIKSLRADLEKINAELAALAVNASPGE